MRFIRKLQLSTVMMLILAGVPAKAAVVTLTFTGTYDNLTFMGVSNFAGLSTTGLTSIPFSYSLTYDTSLNDPNASVVTAGSVVGTYNYVASHDMYGYTSSGLLSVNKSLGNLSWGIGDFQGESPFGGAVGDLWFDVDISQATPTRAWVSFANADSYRSNIGQGGINTVGGTDYILFESRTGILWTGGMSQADVRTTSAPTITSSIPEPAVFSLLAIGLGGLAMMRHRREEE